MAWPPPMAIVEVEWVDSACHPRWREPEETANRPIACRTAGYLLARSADAVTIVLSQNDVGSIAEAMTIPTRVITRLRPLVAAMARRRRGRRPPR